MSLLYLSGEKYHCTCCDNTAVVKYEKEGAYQVGDINVLRQIELKAKYSEPEDDSLYIIEAVCRKCVLRSGRFLVVDDSCEIVKKIEELNRSVKNYLESIDTFLSTYICRFDKTVLRAYFARAIADTPIANNNPSDLLIVRTRKLKERVLSKLNEATENSEEFKQWKRYINSVHSGRQDAGVSIIPRG